MTETIDQETADRLVEYAAQTNKQMEIAEKFMEQGYPWLTAMIKAGDYLSRMRANEALAAGKSVWDASIFVGSYERFDWVIEQYADELIPTKELAEHICDLWRGADPDDCNPYFLFPWEECFDWVGQMLTDEGKSLPNDEYVTVYRGQLSTSEEDIGLSWTLNKTIATRFAMGAALRIRTDGFLATAKVNPEDVLAYITGRNEEELIINPNNIQDITWEAVNESNSTRTSTDISGIN